MTDKTTRPRRRRFISLLALAGGLALAGAAVGQFVGEEAAPPPAAAAAAAATVHQGSGALALSHAADGQPLIAAAQRAARERDDADSYAQLALAFLQRKRETSDAALLHYAKDALAAARDRDADADTTLLVTTLIAQDEHRFREALDLSGEIRSRHPGDPTGHLLAGDALLELGDYAEAVTAYQTALDLRPDLRSYNRAAHLRWLHGDVDGAREALELALDAGSPRDPESMAWCYVDLGTIYLEQGDTQRALAAVDRADRLVPGYVPALILQARAQAAAGDIAAAIASYEVSTERLPHVEDLLALSELYARQGRSTDSATRLDQARRLAGGDPRPLAHHLARHRLDLDEALRLAEQELTQRRNLAALDTHALVLIRRGELDPAKASLDAAMALGTPDAELHLHLALWQLARGDRSAARASLETALSLNPQVDPLLVRELTEETA